MKEKKGKSYYYFWIFIIGSIIGWLFEGTYSLVKYGKLINHSSLVIGPFNTIYGMGSLVFTIILQKINKKNFIQSFLVGFISGSIIEYVISFLMEWALGYTAWNYSKKFMNINGRICLEMSIIWGILGVLWTAVLYPWLKKILVKLDNVKWRRITKYVIVFLLLDCILTICSFTRAIDKDKNIAPANSFEVFLDKTFNKKYLKNMSNDKWRK